jgi:hypothetical protein
MKKLTIENYNKDVYYVNIVKAFDELLENINYVSPILIFENMNLLKPQDINSWFDGKIPYLEKVIQCNLSKASRILRIISFHAHDLNMKKSQTIYKQRGKGKNKLLRFSKTGDENLEIAYMTHFVRMKK